MRKLSGVPETMLQTLYARAEATKKGLRYLQDPKSVELISQIDYDFSNAKQDKMMKSGVIARTILLDQMTEEFLSNNRGTVVVNLACGLDTRCYRMKGKYEKWYNLDLPEPMDIRRQLLPETQQIRQISSSAMDQGWIHEIQEQHCPVLVIIEGLSMYLSESDVRQIFRLLDARFAAATVFLEVMNPWVAGHVTEKSIEGSSAKFSWGVNSGKDLQKRIPPFRWAGDRSLAEGMAVFIPAYKFLSKIGPVRNTSNKIMTFVKE